MVHLKALKTDDFLNGRNAYMQWREMASFFGEKKIYEHQK